MATWTNAEIKLLGQMTDREVAERTGRKLSAVQMYRTSAGIPAFAVHAFVWSPEEDALLGTVTDTVAAERLGVSRKTVIKRRQELGIPSLKEQQRQG